MPHTSAIFQLIYCLHILISHNLRQYSALESLLKKTKAENDNLKTKLAEAPSGGKRLLSHTTRNLPQSPQPPTRALSLSF
jgi:hypothetical protein